MKKSIIVHIGTLKTGSTYIQNFLVDNVKTLRSNDIYFPTRWIERINYKRGGRTPGHAKIVRALKEDNELQLEEIKQDLRDSPCNNIIISSENFCLNPELAQPLAQLLNEFCVKIIVYLRRQDLYLESIYKEFISGGWFKLTQDIHSFYAGDHPYKRITIDYDYFHLLETWSRAFKQDNIIARPFEAQQFYENDLIKDFIHASGHAWSKNYKYPSELSRNSGYAIQVNKILLDLNKIPIDSTSYRDMLDSFYTKNETRMGKEQPYFSAPQFRLEMLKQYKQSNTKVAQKYLARENGILFSDAVPNTNDPYMPVRINDPDLVSNLYSEFLSKLSHALNARIDQADQTNRRLVLAIWLQSRKNISRRIKCLLRSETKIIRKSGLFDTQWYTQQYANVLASSDPVDHYVETGASLGFNPSAKFDTGLFIQNNIPVMNSGINPLVSYILNET